ncbi:MAG TPA: fasciclin domain-containing protein [Solirubrobacterales bacterium]|nr:fasciclin domain-containing protein [Solirubrobacterales bacterium]
MDPRKTLLVALCVPALAFGLAACGSDDSDSNSDSNGSSTAMESTSGMDSSGTDNTATGSADIVALAQGNKDLSTLVKAVTAADLVSTLQGKGPYTVFAPTNEAFAALPPAELNRLLKPANKDELAKILTYHVVEDDVKSSDLKNGQMIKTVEGGKLKVTITPGGKVMVGDATVVMPDVEASNGTIHVIDTVLVPSN